MISTLQMTNNKPSVAQWSRRGRPVSLIDPQEQQLVDGLKYVQKLRAEANDLPGSWGEIRTFHPSSLESSLKDAWLVVEVRGPRECYGHR